MVTNLHCHIPKSWWGKTLANRTPSTNILPSQIPDLLKQLMLASNSPTFSLTKTLKQSIRQTFTCQNFVLALWWSFSQWLAILPSVLLLLIKLIHPAKYLNQNRYLHHVLSQSHCHNYDPSLSLSTPSCSCPVIHPKCSLHHLLQPVCKNEHKHSPNSKTITVFL